MHPGGLRPSNSAVPGRSRSDDTSRLLRHEATRRVPTLSQRKSSSRSTRDPDTVLTSLLQSCEPTPTPTIAQADTAVAQPDTQVTLEPAPAPAPKAARLPIPPSRPLYPILQLSCHFGTSFDIRIRAVLYQILRRERRSPA